MGSSSAPKTPDYTGTAIAQAAADKQMAQYTTQANRVNQIDPYGQTIWTQGSASTPQQQADLAKAQQDLVNYKTSAAQQGWDKYQPAEVAKQEQLIQDRIDAANGSNQWTQTTSLNPQQQALLDQQTAIQGTQNSRISDLLKTFQTPTLQQANHNDIADLLYSQATNNLDKRFATDEAATRASLANQGFQQGSEGYNNSLNDFNISKNNTYQQAQTAASLGGYQQMNAENSQNLENYNSQMGYLSSLLGGVQGPTNPTYPSFAPATGSQSADLTGAQQATYQGNLNASNAKNAQNSQTLGAVGTVATVAAIAF